MANYFTSLFGYLVRDKEAHARLDTHNHDAKYSPVGHNHDDDYAPKTHLHSEYLLKGDIAVLTGTLTAENSEVMETTINLPTGFNSLNSCILAGELHNSSNQNATYGQGSVMDSSSYVRGCLPCAFSISNADIKVRAKNIQIGTTGTVTMSAMTTTFEYRIILLKFA